LATASTAASRLHNQPKPRWGSKALLAVFSLGLAGGFATAMQTREPPALPAERVTGIGGIFFKAQDPKALGTWYREKLGIAIGAMGPNFSIFKWRDQEDSKRAGSTVWALFKSDSKYFDPSKAAFMINYRVGSLDRMLSQLRKVGVNVETKVKEDFNGKFAWIVDPEGNKIELWEPKEGF